MKIAKIAENGPLFHLIRLSTLYKPHVNGFSFVVLIFFLPQCPGVCQLDNIHSSLVASLESAKQQVWLALPPKIVNSDLIPRNKKKEKKNSSMQQS